MKRTTEQIREKFDDFCWKHRRGCGPTRLYLGRRESMSLDGELQDMGLNERHAESSDRREYMGMKVFVVDDANHLEVG